MRRYEHHAWDHTQHYTTRVSRSHAVFLSSTCPSVLSPSSGIVRSAAGETCSIRPSTLATVICPAPSILLQNHWPLFEGNGSSLCHRRTAGRNNYITITLNCPTAVTIRNTAIVAAPILVMNFHVCMQFASLIASRPKSTVASNGGFTTLISVSLQSALLQHPKRDSSQRALSQFCPQ